MPFSGSEGHRPAKLTRVHRHHLASGPMHIDGTRVPAAVAPREVWGAAPAIAAAVKSRTAGEP